MDRLHHLCLTLPHNLHCLNIAGKFEVVLLDYNSKDSLERWILRERAEDLESGLLRYFRTEEPANFQTAHSKNLAHRLATGEIVCNLDADNFLTPEFLELLAHAFRDRTDPVLLVPDAYGGWYGRIALPKIWFDVLGGYDEDLEWGWGYEDDDLRNRARAAGLRIETAPARMLHAIDHRDGERVANCRLKDRAESHRRHELISRDKLDRRILVANRGKVWGAGRLFQYVPSLGAFEISPRETA